MKSHLKYVFRSVARFKFETMHTHSAALGAFSYKNWDVNSSYTNSYEMINLVCTCNRGKKIFVYNSFYLSDRNAYSEQLFMFLPRERCEFRLHILPSVRSEKTHPSRDGLWSCANESQPSVGGVAVPSGRALDSGPACPASIPRGAGKDDGSSWTNGAAGWSTRHGQMPSLPSVPRRPGYLRTRRAAPPYTLVGNPAWSRCASQ